MFIKKSLSKEVLSNLAPSLLPPYNLEQVTWLGSKP